MGYRIGDRFIHRTSKLVVDIIEIEPAGPYRIEYIDRIDSVRKTTSLFLISPQWEYLGNFSKSHNFNTLYEKLSNP